MFFCDGENVSWNDKKRLKTNVFSRFVAEKKGFEPLLRYQRKHDFQSCAFVHSATSPRKRHIVSNRLFEGVNLCNVDYYTIYSGFVKGKIQIFLKKFHAPVEGAVRPDTG